MQFDKDLNSEFKDLFLQAREFLLSYDGISETKKERITTYATAAAGICHMRTMSYGIDLGFLKGAKMQDKYDLLTGKGKVMRVLPQRGQLDEEVIRYFIEQAIEMNSGK